MEVNTATNPVSQELVIGWRHEQGRSGRDWAEVLVPAALGFAYLGLGASFADNPAMQIFSVLIALLWGANSWIAWVKTGEQEVRLPAMNLATAQQLRRIVNDSVGRFERSVAEYQAETREEEGEVG